MAASQTTRLSIYTWSAGTDTFTRDQMTTSHSNLETKVAGYNQAGSRPSAAAAYSGFFHYSSTDSTAGALSYCNGNSWFTIGALSAGTPTPLDGSAAAGSAVDGSRSDHKHAIGTDAIGAAQIAATAVGTSELATDAVTTVKILNNNVTVEKMQQVAGHAILARVGSSTANLTQITADTNEVLRRSGSGNLEFGTLVTANIGANQITNTLMADDAIGTAEIAANAIGVSELATDAVTTVKIDDDAVTLAKLAHTSAGYAILAKGDTGAGALAEITASDGDVLRRIGSGLGFGKITSANITDGTIAGIDMANDAITAAKLATNSVGDDALALGAISVYGKDGSAPAGHVIYKGTGAPASASDYAEGDIWLEYTS
jgi:hypothetical protein